MSNFTDELQRAEEYLKPESYDLCSILCGKTMESILKRLLSLYLQEITQEKQMPITRELASIRKQSISSLTLGEIANIFEKYTILNSFMIIRTIVIEDRQLPDLRILVKIRNKATHVNVTDSEATHKNKNDADLEKSDAFVMYGNILRLATIADQLVSQPRRKKGVEEVTVSQQEIAPTRWQTLGVTAATQPMPHGNMLTLCKNKHSGKYFIFLEEEVKEKILLVIPTGPIKALAKSLFESMFEEEEKEAVLRGKISPEQVKSYHDYQGDEEPLPGLIKTIKMGPREPVIDTPKGRKKFAEQRMSARVLGETLQVTFQKGASKNWILTELTNKREIRRIRDEAVNFARQNDASFGQIEAVKKALTKAGYWLSK